MCALASVTLKQIEINSSKILLYAPNLKTSSILHKTCSSINYMSLFLGQAKLAKSRLFAVVVYLGLKIAIPFRLLENLTSCAINSLVSSRRNTFEANAQVILCSWYNFGAGTCSNLHESPISVGPRHAPAHDPTTWTTTEILRLQT